MKKIIFSLLLSLCLKTIILAQNAPSPAFSSADWMLIKSHRAAGFKEQLITQYAYFTSYNPANRIPNYVSWCLTKEHTDGEVSRKGHKFHANDAVGGIKVESNDYTHSGYNRGHMCPAGDNKWNRTAMDESFLMTNICPQTHALNGGDWKELEEQCRYWAEKYGKIYIVCGPIVPKKAGKRIGYSKVLVPNGFFKVVLCLVGKPKAIGFIYANNKDNKPMNTYAVSVDEVEKQTGIDFFTALKDDIEKQIERSFNLANW